MQFNGGSTLLTPDIHLYRNVQLALSKKKKRNVQLVQIFSLNIHCVYQTLTLDFDYLVASNVNKFYFWIESQYKY